MLSRQFKSIQKLLFINWPTVTQINDFSSSNKNSEPPCEDDIVHLENRADIFIPEYPVRENEPIEKRRQRLLYQSRKRGMLENDLLLSTFAAKYLKTMNAQQIEMYDKMINKPSNDWDIYYWATGHKEIPDEYNNEMMEMFRTHVRNDKKEKRLQMPSLN